jgi:hypothetical protein
MVLAPETLRTRVASARTERLGRIGWAIGLAFDAYGVRFGLRANQADVLDELTALFPPGWRPSRSPVVDRLYSLWLGERTRRAPRFHVLYAGDERRVRTLDREVALDTLEADLRQTVAAQARRLVFVHAGVVGWQGRAILLPGRSCSGKTTLVEALVRAGAIYYSDDFAVVDSKGLVRPFARPLSIRSAEGSRRCDVAELGGVAGDRPLAAAAVIFTEHRDGAVWCPERQSAAQGLLALLRHAVPVRRRPESTVAALEKLVSRAVILQGARGEAEGTARSILERAGDWGRG